ncbi:MAG: D-alanyl-D-alanine carboxypeptidase [Oscillospiraceae bacterium]|nr:D-alanyl-D-alanine carboxypeptidase [Oscillospiraceae bacterium]
MGCFAFETGQTDEFLQLTGAAVPSALPTAAGSDAAAQAAQAMQLSATAAILIERQTGQVLYEKNADDPRAIASITKVMTLLLTVEALEQGRISLTDEVVTSEHAYSMGGSQIWLEPGEVMTVDELMRAVCVQSANDAAVALAEAVSGSEESFVAAMNAKAAELGMTGTTFKNSNGLDEAGHMSCARDVAVMSNALLQHEIIRDYCTIWMDSLRGGETQLTNTNKMLKSYEGITGLKTGTTSKAGVCIAASAERDGMELIAVVLGCPDSKSRFADAKKLLDHGFAYYELAPLSLPEESITPVRVKGGVQQHCAYRCELPAAVLVEKGKRASVHLELTVAESLQAPVEAGQQLGQVGVYCDGQLLCAYPVTAAVPVAKMRFADAFVKLLRSFLCM